MHVLLKRKRDFLLYLSFPNSIAQLTRMEHEGTVTVSVEPLMLMDGYQGQPYRITH